MCNCSVEVSCTHAGTQQMLHPGAHTHQLLVPWMWVKCPTRHTSHKNGHCSRCWRFCWWEITWIPSVKIWGDGALPSLRYEENYCTFLPLMFTYYQLIIINYSRFCWWELGWITNVLPPSVIDSGKSCPESALFSIIKVKECHFKPAVQPFLSQVPLAYIEQSLCTPWSFF